MRLVMIDANTWIGGSREAERLLLSEPLQVVIHPYVRVELLLKNVARRLRPHLYEVTQWSVPEYVELREFARLYVRYLHPISFVDLAQVYAVYEAQHEGVDLDVLTDDRNLQKSVDYFRGA